MTTCLLNSPNHPNNDNVSNSNINSSIENNPNNTEAVSQVDGLEEVINILEQHVHVHAVHSHSELGENYFFYEMKVGIIGVF